MNELRRNAILKGLGHYGVSIFSVLVALSLRLILRDFLQSSAPYITFYPAVTLASWFGGIGPGLLAAALSITAVFYFVIPPLHRFLPANFADAMTALMFLGFAFFVCILNETLRRTIAKSEERFRQLQIIESELNRTNQELRRANRELEEFAFVASHDLQEPLRTVNIYTQLILKRLDSQDAQAATFAGYVAKGVARIETLVRDLLEYSRSGFVDEAPAAETNLSHALEEALTMLKTFIDDTGAVITADPLPVLPLKSSHFSHVFQNLLSNSLKYRKADVTPKIHITAKPEAGFWIVSVEDNGIGFDQQYAERIFALFQRLYTGAYPGTGLGLAICRRIVERCGGRIWAQGRLHEGATFYFSLPKGPNN